MRRLPEQCGVVALAAALAASLACTPPSADPPAPARDAAAILRLDPYFRTLRTVRIDSAVGPLTMLFDTGGGATLVTPAAADRAGCRPYGRDVGHRMSGERVEFRRCDGWDLRVDAWRATVDPLGVFDVNALLPPELPRLDGVLALDAFRGRVVTFDWRAGQVRVHAETGHDRGAAAVGLVHRIATGDSGRFLSAFVPVQATRGRLWFLLDSGNISGTLVARHVVAEGLLAIAAAGDTPLVVDGQAPWATPVQAADLVIDGALGTAYLMNGPVTLDLRTASPRP